jgi:hypothetical protein
MYFFRGCGGGLGDFLSNYASMKALSLDFGRDFYLYGYNEYINWNHNLCQYIKRDTTGWTDLFKEKNKFVDVIREQHKNYITMSLPFVRDLNLDFGDFPHIHIDGFPFTNSYFEHRLEDILQSLNLPNSLSVNDNLTVLNTRRGEYPNASPEFIDLCQTNYYKKALEKIQTKEIILVSDDVNWTKLWWFQTLAPHFPHISVSIYQEKPILQFELMMKAKNLIICQSQFTRWAAILNKNNVYSPKNWYKSLDRDYRDYNLAHWNVIEY